MSILKLQPGQKVHFKVFLAETVEGNFGPQIKFSGTTPDDPSAVLFLNVDTATRQLERISLTPFTVPGNTVEFERVEKNGTKYTNINRVSAGVDFTKLHKQTGAIADARVTAETLDKGRSVKQPLSSGGPLPWEKEETHDQLDKMFNVYDACLDHAHEAAKRRFGNDVTDTAVAAMAATLYIQASQKGVGQ